MKNALGEAMPRTCWDRLPGEDVKRQHVNLDSGRRYRLLPRDRQPDCGCDECLQIRLRATQLAFLKWEQAKR